MGKRHVLPKKWNLSWDIKNKYKLARRMEELQTEKTSTKIQR